jgi:hypothetical protein
MPKPVTGKYSIKKYRCTNPDCLHEHNVGTNHWGEIYSRCPKCAWKTPMNPYPQECMESAPEGYGIPEKWTIVRLGDIAEIKHGVRLP